MVCCAEYCAFTALNSVCSCLNGNFGYPLIVLLFTVMGLVFRFDDSAQSSLNWLADYGGKPRLCLTDTMRPIERVVQVLKAVTMSTVMSRTCA